jgi:PAS domain S-box-containing protein
MPADPRSAGLSGAAERRLTAEYVTARALVESATLAEATPRILQAICEALGWEHGAFWAVDHDGNVLRCVESWHPPGLEFREFDAISRRTVFPPGIGLPGRVWASGRPAWIPDVVRDTNFPRAPIAAREGLHGAFGFPILHNGSVRSVMEFFSREIREPDEELLQMLATVGSQIGLFLERKRAEEELDRFFTLSLDLLCIAGLDGRFKRVNPAWRMVLGYTEAELLTTPYLELVHPEDRAATAAEAERLAAGAKVVYFENRYLCKDGTHRWLLWTATPFPDRGLIYAIARDITERKEAETTLARYARELEQTRRVLEDQAVRQAQLMKELDVARRRAEEAAEAKSEFLANMSHEIRTPLNAILGMTELALRSKLSRGQRDYLTAAKSSAHSLLAIIDDILDFSKIEARRLELERAPFDLRETVGDTARMLALRAEEKGLELAYHVAPDVPDALVGDAGRLRQVLVNLLGNAIKFTERGEIVLRVGVERDRDGTSRLHFAVSDTGVGIPADKRRQIFDAFVQADSSTTRRYGGTGLGLAISSRLVALMDGRIWVESREGRGSTFHFSAAFDRPDGTAAPPLAARPAELEGLRVLVVDDNGTNRRILEEMLVSWRMRPSSVGRADAALDALTRAASRGAPFGLVITDYQMPEMDGLTLARRINRRRGRARPPVIMLTSAGRPEDVARSRELGLAACLTKPVKHSDLLDAIATVFGGGVRRPRRADRPPAAARRRLRVLVAEDNPVGRKLVATLLRRRGHVVTTVATGREALAAIEDARAAHGAHDGHDGFDLVLMDVQMPEMGGLEAAAAIRDRERLSGGRLPIVALTAHALQGDRERCLAAGMDGYLSKPIDVDQLVSTVERIGGAATGGAARTGTTPSGEPFDERATLARVGGDRRLMEEVVRLFRADYPGTLRRIESAVRRRDAEGLRTAAHALKGSVATFGAQAARDAAQRLEQMGGTGDFAHAKDSYAALRAGLARLEDAFGEAGLTRRKRRPRPKRSIRVVRGPKSRRRKR